MMFRVALLLILLVTSHTTSAKTPAEKFFSKHGTFSASLSPDGKQVALIENSSEGQKLYTKSSASGKRIDLLNLADFTENNAQIRKQVWIDNKRIAVQFTEIKKGVKTLLDTKGTSYLLIVEVPQKAGQTAVIKSVRTKGWLIDPLANEEDKFLYAKSGIYSKVYQIKPSQLSPHKKKLNKLMRKDGGQFVKKNERASVSGYATHWFINRQGEAAAVLYFSSGKSMLLSRLSDNQEVTELKRWDRDKIFGNEGAEKDLTRQLMLPVAMGENEETYYCLDFAEEKERTVYKVNFKTGKSEVIYKTDQYEIIELIMSEQRDSLIGVKLLKDGGIENAYLDTDGATTKSSSTHIADLHQTIATSQDKKVSLIYSEQHNQPGKFLIKNQNSEKTEVIARRYPQLKDRLTTHQIESSVLVEGMEIPYILTLPEKGKKNLPLIVYPHGGPIGVFDHRYFEASTQYMAANGFAVLRVNYRGSSGHGIALEEAGKKQWGKLILKDILEATKKVSKLDEINPRKVCIFGISYGGYAATMLSIKHPEIYRCAVNVAGVSDVNLYLNTPYRSDRQDTWMKEYIGDTEKEYESLKKISPLYSVRKLQRPLLILHGMQDEVVDVEHAFRLKLMLEKHNKPFEWHIFPDSGHNFLANNDTQVMYSKAVTFIDTQL
ncbi:alpha/beta hydrolase family protein [Aliikangiella coralliicola]|uniref:S9 family peptidase n=1 Tax=Aliikangiella coralliicola TaxID=2592383 RepID=A0A545UEA6_9GAMM|nr:YqiA/YcfP family alpha/beta fold hydrolase [Aliikangiella coralliicola]TQV87810.1 S9 family peptidase [Aliikangiella coralliicola]